MTGKPRVELSFTESWCPRHLDPFRADWPRGCAVGMLALFDEAVRMPAVVDHASGDAHGLEAALRRFSPLCCFVGKDALDRVYGKAGVTR